MSVSHEMWCQTFILQSNRAFCPGAGWLLVTLHWWLYGHTNNYNFSIYVGLAQAHPNNGISTNVMHYGVVYGKVQEPATFCMTSQGLRNYWCGTGSSHVHAFQLAGFPMQNNTKNWNPKTKLYHFNAYTQYTTKNLSGTLIPLLIAVRPAVHLQYNHGISRKSIRDQHSIFSCLHRVFSTGCNSVTLQFYDSKERPERRATLLLSVCPRCMMATMELMDVSVLNNEDDQTAKELAANGRPYKVYGDFVFVVLLESRWIWDKTKASKCCPRISGTGWYQKNGMKFLKYRDIADPGERRRRMTKCNRCVTISLVPRPSRGRRPGDEAT